MMGEVSPAIIRDLSHYPPMCVYLPQQANHWIGSFDKYDPLSLVVSFKPIAGHTNCYASWSEATQLAGNLGFDSITVVWDDLTETTFYLPK